MKVLEIYTGNRETSVEFSISGSGFIEIDWGDNTDIQKLYYQKHSLTLFIHLTIVLGVKERSLYMEKISRSKRSTSVN